MKKTKKSNLVFTINVKDFSSDKAIIEYLNEAINTSLQLSRDKEFSKRMKLVNGFELSLKNNLNISINDCSCN